MASGLIAVTGATGAVGSRVTARLAAADIRPRLIVRDPTRLSQGGAGADVRRVSAYGAREEMHEALQGVHTLLLIPASEAPDRVRQHRSTIDAALSAGVQRLVYQSFFGAAPDATFTFARDHWQTEEHIRALDMPWTFLRMNLYADIIPALAGPDGVVRGPAGNGRVAAVLRDDVAASAAAVLTSDGHDGRTYDLTGPESFSLRTAAATMSRLAGKAIRFEDETDAEAFASRQGLGAEFEIAGWVSSYQAIRDGSLEPVSGDVLALTGRPPRALADHLASQPGALDHVAG